MVEEQWCLTAPGCPIQSWAQETVWSSWIWLLKVSQWKPWRICEEQLFLNVWFCWWSLEPHIRSKAISKSKQWNEWKIFCLCCSCRCWVGCLYLTVSRAKTADLKEQDKQQISLSVIFSWFCSFFCHFKANLFHDCSFIYYIFAHILQLTTVIDHTIFNSN